MDCEFGSRDFKFGLGDYEFGLGDWMTRMRALLSCEFGMGDCEFGLGDWEIASLDGNEIRRLTPSSLDSWSSLWCLAILCIALFFILSGTSRVSLRA